MKTITNTVMLLLLAANICFAQAIITGDPAEPCGPIRPDYWIGKHDRRSPIRGEVGACTERSRSEGSNKERQQTKAFAAAALDSYIFYTNVRVNDNPAGTSFETPYSSGGHSIAARGDTVYLAWRSDRSGTSAIYFDKSFDSGTTWGTDVAISDNPAAAAVMPALALGKDGTIYVSWTDFRDGNRHIYFAKSTDGGTSFGPSVRVQAATEDKQEFSSIAVNDSGYIFIAYEDFRNLTTTAIDIYCSRSVDGGISFESAVKVNSDADSISQWSPSMAVIDSNVFIVWKDFRDTAFTGGGDMIYFSKSNNVGVMFNNRVLVNDTTGFPSYNVDNPSISIADTNLYVAWLDTRNSGNCDIYLTKSTDDGTTFNKPNINLIDVVGESFYQGYPSLCCDDSGGVYCAWEDTRVARQIFFGYSKDYGDSFSLNYPMEDSGYSTWSWMATLCANKTSNVFVAWMDNRNNTSAGRYDIYTTAGIVDGVAGYPSNEKLPMNDIKLTTFPNPFTGLLNIKYQLAANTKVTAAIYNITGQLIKRLEQKQVQTGEYKRVWNGTDNHGNRVKSGIYLVCLNINGKTNIRKATYIK